ncbi:uncharacterized protein LOC124164501 [Ischnura elegans]|uniref:uncharacterized protein LOC124164501 n=1 Tax=Ischnura elegans TaxID=197161 RepID=UPI001ED88476|nr:uncharacterized protein LOC124164501 [Ischnura elegans]
MATTLDFSFWNNLPTILSYSVSVCTLLIATFYLRQNIGGIWRAFIGSLGSLCAYVNTNKGGCSEPSPTQCPRRKERRPACRRYEDEDIYEEKNESHDTSISDKIGGAAKELTGILKKTFQSFYEDKPEGDPHVPTRTLYCDENSTDIKKIPAELILTMKKTRSGRIYGRLYS